MHHFINPYQSPYMQVFADDAEPIAIGLYDSDLGINLTNTQCQSVEAIAP